MDFRNLEYFKAVVDAGSVSQAAKALGMTQPPVSTAIAKLERELGVRLLDRTAKGVQPTNAGHYLLVEATRLIGDRDRLAESLSQMGNGIAGDLRIGVEPMVINEFIADVLGEFLDQAPGARATLTDVTPDAIFAGLRSGELDVGCVPFSPHQCASYVHTICDSEALIDLDLKLAVPHHRLWEDHPDGQGWGRWILPYKLPTFVGFPEFVERGLATDPTLEVLEVSTPQTAVSFVAAGLGVAPVTARMASHNPTVALLDPPSWLGPMQATMLWRRDVEFTPLMQRWMTAARDVATRLTAS